MMNRILLSLILNCVIMSVTLSAAQAKSIVLPVRKDATLDFDFHGVKGKTSFKDRTGNYTLYSDTAPMLEEEGSLRVSDSARLRIPCKDHAFGEKVTISMWFLNTASTWTWHLPLLERGIQEDRGSNVIPPIRPFGKYDFTLYFVQEVPGFVIGRTGKDKVGTEGIVSYGSRYGNSKIIYNKHYPNWPAITHRKPAELVKKNYWQHITAVYDHGATKIYLDGKLCLEAPTKRKEKFLTSGEDLYIGAFRTESDLNKCTAEILVKSLTITPRILSDREIADLYAREGKLLNVKKRRPNLKLSQHYYTPDRKAADPSLKKTLKITADYMKKLPADPYKGNKNMRARFDENRMLEINGKKYPPVMVNMYHYERSPKRRKIILSDFAAAGVDCATFDLRRFWLGEDKYDFKALDKLLKTYVEGCPTVKITLVISLTPEKWFWEKYPEEMECHVRNFRSKNAKVVPWNARTGQLGSEKFRLLSEKMLKAVIRHCEKSPYANHIYGYQLFGGDAGEWYWPGLFTHGGSTGYSEPTRQQLIRYLRKKYNNDVKALQKAWRDHKLTFETVKMPSPMRRYAAENGLFRDPGTTQDITDVRKFLTERTKECFLSATKIIRENAPNKIIGIYNGYVILYSHKSNIFFSGMQNLSDAFRSPYIDLISTPIDYEFRRYKHPGVNINGFNGTAALYGKSLWREEDSGTHLIQSSTNSRAGSLRETLEVKRRAYGYTMAGNYGFWYCFQMPLHGFHEEKIMEDTRRMKRLADASVNHSRKSVAQVAVVFDEKDSVLYCTPSRYSDFLKASLWDLYVKLHNAGIPFDLYFTEDLSHKKMPDYKMYIFMNQWAVNDDTLTMIRKKLARNNALAVWQYAPGYFRNGKTDLKNMSRVTGMQFAEKRKAISFAPRSVRYKDSALTKGVPMRKESLVLSPVFSVKPSPGVEILSTANGLNIMAQKGNHFWTLLPLNTQLIHNLCKKASVHIYSKDQNTLMVNESYLMVHTLNDRPFTVDLPGRFKVKACIGGKTAGITKQIREKVPAGTTCIYHLEKLP